MFTHGIQEEKRSTAICYRPETVEVSVIGKEASCSGEYEANIADDEDVLPSTQSTCKKDYTFKCHESGISFGIGSNYH